MDYEISVWKNPKVGHMGKPRQFCFLLVVRELAVHKHMNCVISRKKLLKCSANTKCCG